MSSQEHRSGQGREVCLHTGSHHVSTGGFGIDAFELSSFDPILLDELVGLVWRCRWRFEYSLRRARVGGLGYGQRVGGGRDVSVIVEVQMQASKYERRAECEEGERRRNRILDEGNRIQRKREKCEKHTLQEKKKKMEELILNYDIVKKRAFKRIGPMLSKYNGLFVLSEDKEKIHIDPSKLREKNILC